MFLGFRVARRIFRFVREAVLELYHLGERQPGDTTGLSGSGV